MQGKVTASVPSSGSFGEQLSGSTIFVNGTVNVLNQGYYSITNLMLNASVLTSNGGTLYNYTDYLPEVHPGTNTSLPVTIPIPSSALYSLYSQAGPAGNVSVVLSFSLHGSYAFDTVNFEVHLTSGTQLSLSGLKIQQGAI